MDKQELQLEFSRYWERREAKGEVSGLDRIEWIVIEMFIDWLLVRYRITPHFPEGDK